MTEIGSNNSGDAGRAKVIAAFAAVYIIWGSTYLAIRFAIETLPPFLMAGARFLIAGGLLYGWSRLRGAARPARAHWVAAAIIGTLLLMGGNGAVVWAEQRVPSGVAALIVAITPCWMVLLDWARPGGVRPPAAVFAGLTLGLAGLVLLVGPQSIIGGGRIDTIGTLVLLLGSLCWATGSIYSRHVELPQTPLLATGMQMLAGGSVLTLAGLATGETARLNWSGVSVESVLALLYLIVFGAIVGYTAYVWLLRKSTAARVSTYAYVNPVVAVLLGWAFAGEALTARMGLAAVVIVGGVALITLARNAQSTRPSPRTLESRRVEAEVAGPAARSGGVTADPCAVGSEA